MKTEKTGMQRKLIVGALTAASFALPYMVKAHDVVETRTTIIGACGKLFSIDSDAAGMTAQERAAIVQRNLDNALVAAKNRNPDCVKVQMMNNNPIVTVDHFYIVTADGNSAARANMTQLDLAQKWADSIKFCLADAKAMDKYTAMLTGKFVQKTTVSSLTINKDVAVAPRGMALPVQLANTLATAVAQPGDSVQAVLSTDVPLGPNFTSYIPAGTVALGEVESATPYSVNHLAGKRAVTLTFFALKTPDGKEIPITGHIQGGVNSWRYVSIKPLSPVCCGEKGKTVEARDEYGNLKTVLLTASKGEIGGAWKGLPQDQETKEGFRRLLLSKNNPLVIPAGEPMFLQLSATSSIAVNAAPQVQTSEMISSAGIGM